MKDWKARKYFKGQPVATKMFRTQEEAMMFAEDLNSRRLFDDVMWKVERTYRKGRK